MLDLIWLAVVVAILGLGFATVAWEWRKAHSAASNYRTETRNYHGAQQHNPPDVTRAERRK